MGQVFLQALVETEGGESQGGIAHLQGLLLFHGSPGLLFVTRITDSLDLN